MPKPYLRDLRAEAEEAVREVGEWVVAGVQTSIPWPTKMQIVTFEGFDFILRPGSDRATPTICLNAQKFGLTAKDARDRILRFGSALAWSESNSFEVSIWTGGTRAVGVGRMQGNVAQDFLDCEFLPAIPNEDAATALALYREGLSSASHFYAFLSLFKTISFVYRDGKRREDWFKQTLPNLTEQRAVQRIQDLRALGVDVSQYLWDEGRNAIAHAERDVIVNPDKTIDHERIYADLPIVQALARKAIQERFRVWPRLSQEAPDRSLIEGFESLLGKEIIESAANSIDIRSQNIESPDSITVVVRNCASFRYMDGLRIKQMRQAPESIIVQLTNIDETLVLIFTIQCKEKRLVFEPFGQHAGTSLNQTSRSSIDLAMRMHELIWRYLCNGRLEVWDEEHDELLGMTDPYIPFNALLDSDAHDRETAEFERLRSAATNE